MTDKFWYEIEPRPAEWAVTGVCAYSSEDREGGAVEMAAAFTRLNLVNTRTSKAWW